MTLVTAVVTAYNRPDMVERAVASIAAQTYPDIELVVVDDASDVPIESALADWGIDESRFVAVRFVRHAQNRGVAEARNTALRAARGEYVAYLDDDDEWHPEKVDRQVRAFEAGGPDVGLVYTGVRHLCPDGTLNATETDDFAGDVRREILREDFLRTYSVVMVRRETALETDGNDPSIPVWDDWDFYIQMATRSEFRAVPVPLVDRHTGHRSLTSDFRSRLDVSYGRMLEKHADLAASLGMRGEFEAFLAFALAKSVFMHGDGNYRLGRRLLIRAIRAYPYEPRFYLHLALIAGGKYTLEPARSLKRAVVRATDRRESARAAASASSAASTSPPR